MKREPILLALAVLLLASFACQTLPGGGPSSPSGGGDSISATPSAQGNDTGGAGNGGNISESGFPMTDDAYNVTEIGDGSLLYYTKLSLEDVMKFYRDIYASMGYEERESATVVEGGVFSMVFDGDPSGKAVIIQSVDLGDGSRTVAIRLEDV